MSAPYAVRTYHEHYTMIELSEASTSSSVTLCPERGGIAISCKLNDLELFYLDESTFIDPNANIRGGNPILFPICGQLENAEYNWNGTTYPMRNHGVARTSAWEVVSQSDEEQASVTLRLASNATTLQSYPFDFELLFTYTLKDGQLLLDQQYRNNGSETMPMYAGFHPYFNTETKNIAYETDATVYLDYNDMAEKPFEGSLDLSGMVESVTLLDPVKPTIAFPVAGGRTVRLSYSDNFRYVVLWSVDGKPFFCVEPWMAKTTELNVQQELVMVEPSKTVHASLTIALDPK
ncbi:aldose epimerase family protein [Paenibacillus sp. MMS18-CY102]|uniref:aldose epimerase family protein n=1 Tax=Paenibacillus sp. MMS18-CY102 TaxID=2682849 RepID=UPI001365A880|nr:aldose epimerase [Paenibacillus sp. MMS18-CY102]MWC27810.1 aldose epimerase [Paenibacillus sp. MMS18-CY102]